jgi:hypothetical protein
LRGLTLGGLGGLGGMGRRRGLRVLGALGTLVSLWGLVGLARLERLARGGRGGRHGGVGVEGLARGDRAGGLLEGGAWLRLRGLTRLLARLGRGGLGLPALGGAAGVGLLAGLTWLPWLAGVLLRRLRIAAGVRRGAVLGLGLDPGLRVRLARVRLVAAVGRAGPAAGGVWPGYG